ncbi:hypothetical protein ACHAXT_012720 [Thalassiosira profunda]
MGPNGSHRGMGRGRRRWPTRFIGLLAVFDAPTSADAFLSSIRGSAPCPCVAPQCPRASSVHHHHRNPILSSGRHCNQFKRNTQRCKWRMPQLHVAPEAAAAVATTATLADYAPAAASLFNNMKLPAAVVTAGMISLGFATRFPELPKDTLDKVYPPETRRLCAKLDRLHIVLGLISVTSELIVVLWAAVEVNQLTERSYEPAYSVWDLIHRDCDLAWSAVNSHFILGIIGFTAMLWLRAYVLLLAAKASDKLMIAASTGTAAALCLMISIVNRGVESGGGNSADSYGHNIFDLVSHYASLLLQVSTNVDSPGPLQLSAVILEITSLSFMFVVLLQESDGGFEEKVDEDSCPVDAYDLLNGEVDGATTDLSATEIDKLKRCMELEEEERRMQQDPSIKYLVEEEEEEEKRRESGDSPAVVS